jgi:hypothetical protein
MQLTLELPESLAITLQTYLQEHPNENPLTLLQEALEIKQAQLPKNPAKLLELAGIVATASTNARDHAEDEIL